MIKLAITRISGVIFFLFIILSVSFVRVSASARDEADSAIRSSEEKILECYSAVLDAERAGADVTPLLEVLNEAGDLLSKAQLAYNKGDFYAARDLAYQSLVKLEGFVEKAKALEEAATIQGFYDFMINFVGSISGAVAVIIFSFVFWRALEKKYGRTENTSS